MQKADGSFGAIRGREPGHVGNGNGEACADRQSKPGERLEFYATGAQRTLIKAALHAHAERDEADIVDRDGALGHAPSPATRRSSSSSSSLRVIPIVSRSS